MHILNVWYSIFPVTSHIALHLITGVVSHRQLTGDAVQLGQFQTWVFNTWPQCRSKLNGRLIIKIKVVMNDIVFVWKFDAMFLNSVDFNIYLNSSAQLLPPGTAPVDKPRFQLGIPSRKMTRLSKGRENFKPCHTARVEDYMAYPEKFAYIIRIWLHVVLRKKKMTGGATRVFATIPSATEEIETQVRKLMMDQKHTLDNRKCH